MSTDTEVLAPGLENISTDVSICIQLWQQHSVPCIFQSFLGKSGALPNSLKEQLHNLVENPSGERLELVEESPYYTKLKDQYEQYTEKIRLEEHGVV